MHVKLWNIWYMDIVHVWSNAHFHFIIIYIKRYRTVLVCYTLNKTSVPYWLSTSLYYIKFLISSTLVYHFLIPVYYTSSLYQFIIAPWNSKFKISITSFQFRIALYIIYLLFIPDYFYATAQSRLFFFSLLWSNLSISIILVPYIT